MAGLMDMIGKPINIWGMINRLPSLFNIYNMEEPKIAPYPEMARFIKEQEGSRNYYYKDTEGNWTSGVGHLENKNKDIFKNTAIINGEEVAVDSGGNRIMIDEDKVNKQYDKDLQTAYKDAREVFGNDFLRLPQEVKNVLTSLSFNLGKSKLLKYRRMKESVENFDKESWVDNNGNLRDGGIAGIAQELIYTNYDKDPNKISPRFKQTGDRTSREITYMLQPAPKSMPTLEPITPTPQQQYEAARMNRPPLTPPRQMQAQIPPPQPQMQAPRIDKSHMLPEPKPSFLWEQKPQMQAIDKSHMLPEPKPRSLQQVAQTAQAQPVLNPFPWLKEVSGSYSHPSPPVGRWI